MGDLFKSYRNKLTGELYEFRPWTEGDDLSGIGISEMNKQTGSPKAGDMIYRTRKNELWLVSAEYFADHFEPEPVALPEGEARSGH